MLGHEILKLKDAKGLFFETDELLVEVAHLEEMVRLGPDVTPERIEESKSVLLRRNERLTEWMIWQSLRGFLKISYGPTSSVTIDWKIPSRNQPTVAIPWTDRANALPLTDLRAFVEQAAGDVVVMNSRTVSIAAETASIKGPEIAFKDWPKVIGARRIVINDAGYRGQDRGQEPAQYLQDGEVFVLPDWEDETVEPIGVTCNGQVHTKEDENKTSHLVMGPLSEIFEDNGSKYLRVVMGRMPVIAKPERVYRANVCP